MPLKPEVLTAQRADDEPCSYDERDCIQYALSLGFGRDPSQRDQLAYVYENGPMRTIPTMANRFLHCGFLKDSGWDYERLVHVGERLDLYRPLPPRADMLANRRVTGYANLGKAVGALITVDTELRLAKDDTVLANVGRTLLARGDGSDGAVSGQAPQHHSLPRRDPDLTCDFQTPPNQALIFRLVDSMNPMHVEWQAASRAGFSRPVLQGRCTYGIACHAILETICDFDFTLITGMDVRFSAPVYPGDLIRTEMWQDGNEVSFRCRVPERDSIVIDNGKCTLAG